jgi:zinc protease
MGTAELGRVRNAVMLALPGQFDTNAAVVQGYANQWVIGQPIEALRALPAQLGSVTAAAALQAARQHVDPARLTVVAVGDRAQIGPQLKKARGTVLELGLEGEPLK